MTKGSKTALTFGLVGALGLGIWAGNEMANRSLESGTQAAVPIAKPAPLELTVPAPKPRVVRARRSLETAATTATPAVTRTDAAADAVTASSITATSPDLHARLKTVLNRGANLSIASNGFRDGEQFATIAHAARNTEVPFMLLKHRVLDEGKSLADAIRESKPDLNAASEAERARTEARADLEAISSN